MYDRHDSAANDCGFEPPSDWVWGVCQGCSKPFKPKLPKQYWCKTCRSAPVGVKKNFPPRKDTELLLDAKHPIAIAASRKGLSLKEVMEATGFTAWDFGQLNRYSFVKTLKYPNVYKLCGLLKASVTALFPQANKSHLSSYRKWEVQHGARHTLS